MQSPFLVGDEWHNKSVKTIFKDSNEIEKRVTLTSESILKQFDEIMDVFEDYYVIEMIEGARRESVEKNT